MTSPVPAARGAYVFDAAADFSTAENHPNSRWSYRFTEDFIRDGDYPLLPTTGPARGGWSPSAPTVWHQGLSSQLPQIGVNNTGTDVTYAAGPAFLWPQDRLLLEPGGNGFAIVTWLAPATGEVTVSFSVTDLDTNGGDGYSWFLEVNDETGSLVSGSFPNGGGLGGATLSSTIGIHAGDRIHFGVGPRGLSGFDATGLTLRITAEVIPEPGSGATSLTALGTLASCRRRPRRDP